MEIWRPGDPAARQLGDARDHRHPRRRRRQGCAGGALRRLAEGPAPGLQGALGENPQAAGLRSSEPARIRRSTSSSARSSSSASRSAPTAISPTSASCSTGRARPTARSGGELRRSVPMLLIPVMISAGTRHASNCATRGSAPGPNSGRRRARSTMSASAGMGVDPLLVNAAQADRPGRGWWRNIIDLYGAADILGRRSSSSASIPGGPAVAQFVGRHGPDKQIVGGFTISGLRTASTCRSCARAFSGWTGSSLPRLPRAASLRDPSLDIPDRRRRRGVIEEEAAAGAGAHVDLSGADRLARSEHLQFRHGSPAHDERGRAGRARQHQSRRRQLCERHLSAAIFRASRAARLRADGASSRAATCCACRPRRGGPPSLPPPPPPPQPRSLNRSQLNRRRRRRRNPPAEERRMKREADQIALPLDWPQTEGESRFIVSATRTASAFDHFRNWSLWPVKATVLTGPRRSGRTPARANFAERVHGRVIDRPTTGTRKRSSTPGTTLRTAACR